MIAHDEPHIRRVQQQLKAFARIRTNADHVAKTINKVAPLGANGCKRGGESRQIGMYIGEDRSPHCDALLHRQNCSSYDLTAARTTMSVIPGSIAHLKGASPSTLL
jgi:hypothetical protein